MELATFFGHTAACGFEAEVRAAATFMSMPCRLRSLKWLKAVKYSGGYRGAGVCVRQSADDKSAKGEAEIGAGQKSCRQM